jgi:uncharacterized protein YfdQ (DUF2303 family)
VNRNLYNNTSESGDTPQTEYEAAFEAGARSVGVIFPNEDVDSIPFLLVPDGFKVESVERFLPFPQRRRACVSMTSVESFTRYINEFKSDDAPRIFAAKSRNALTCIFDYHTPGGANGWNEHQAILGLSLSKEWQTWLTSSGRALSQVAFAEFLEDNFLNIVEPNGATVLQAAAHLEAKKTVSFKSGVRLDNGAVQLSYEENVDGKGKGNLVIPSTFTLGIPVFENGDPVAVEARLRYRIKDDVLTFTYILNNPQKVLDTAFDAVLTQVQADTGIAPYLGSSA